MKTKIAFVLLRTLGDVVLGNTLVKEIKRTYPDSHLTWFVNAEYAELVRYNPLVDKVRYPPRWDEVLIAISSDFDIVMLPYQTTPEDNAWHQVDKHRHQHLLDFYAKRCGITIQDRKLYAYPQTNAWKYEPKDRTIALHSTTLVTSKNWQGLPELVTMLRADGYRTVQVGSTSDVVLKEVDEDLRGRMDLSELTNYLSKCTAMIGMDSGLSYVAAATGIPTFVIQGPTIPLTSGPFGTNVTNILSETREECQDRRCHGNCAFAKEEPNGSCINRLTVERAVSIVNATLTGQLGSEHEAEVVPLNTEASEKVTE